MTNVVSLGNFDLKAKPVQECSECHSRKIVTVSGEVDSQQVSAFVRARAQRLGLNLADYDIKVDKHSGAVTATPKETEVEFDLS